MRPHHVVEPSADPQLISPLAVALTTSAPLIHMKLEALKASLSHEPLSFEANSVAPSLTALLEREEFHLSISLSDRHVCFLIELYDHQISEVSMLLNGEPLVGAHDEQEDVYVFELALDEFLGGGIECELSIVSGERVRFLLSPRQQDAS